MGPVRGWQCRAASRVGLHVLVPAALRGARGCCAGQCYSGATRTPSPPAPQPRREDRGGSVVQPLPPSLSQKPELKPERVAAQKAIDGVLVPVIKKTPLMDGYLKTLFSLSKADVPHKMKF